jgi:CheY-like chemotaxis protein
VSESRPKRILVVDDEEDVQVLICRILRDAGFEVDSAEDGAVALERLSDRRPDLVVLDLMMPGIDGWGVLERMRDMPRPPPVVVLTARTDFGTFTRGVREGASAYVCKPFRFHELVATCQRLLLAVTKQDVGPERRREERRLLMVEVRVLSRDNTPIALGHLANLSAGGAQVDLGLGLQPGDRVRVAFHIPAGTPLSLEGTVRWREVAGSGFAHGVAFVTLPAEAESQLREMLRPA